MLYSPGHATYSTNIDKPPPKRLHFGTSKPACMLAFIFDGTNRLRETGELSLFDKSQMNTTSNRS